MKVKRQEMQYAGLQVKQQVLVYAMAIYEAIKHCRLVRVCQKY